MTLANCVLHLMRVILYADDILLISLSVTNPERMLHRCEHELAWLDMSINRKKNHAVYVLPLAVIPFLTCASHTDAHVIDIGCTSVRPFVCSSHAGIVSNRLNLSSNCLHCLVASLF